MLNASIDLSRENLEPDSPSLTAMMSEAESIRDYLSEQYIFGIDTEEQWLRVALGESMMENYLSNQRVDFTYSRLMELPALEAEIRPAIRDSNVATVTVATLDKFLAMTEVGEEYGVHPIQVIDSAVVPIRAIEPAWNQLLYLVPTMLFVSTLWFGIVHVFFREAGKNREEKSGTVET
jgi:hypothetical protein